ncbi:MAG TPA: trypsin-like peptidase domain-containing protein [Patescibacteria group bacterium]|jgi:serine protease Do|nr:trypsin-like peptidase domain-containing protein [Patescibacteria group bacterium]
MPESILPETTSEEKDKGLIADLPPTSSKMDNRLISTVILLSFVFGLAGSVVGNSYVLPFTKKSSTLTGGVGDVKVVQVKEESAVIDVVKKASPAVVSIIISKDLNKIPGYSSSPFDFGPFGFDPFSQSRNTTPNIPNIQEIGGGTGFIITKEGLIVTNKHVVSEEGATYSVLMNDGKKYDAKVLSRDPVNDLALVKIEAADLPTLPLGDSSNIQIGQTVIAIGNSLGQYRNTVTTGVVSGIGRTITASGGQGSEQLEGVIQTDAAINPGNSGGPLLDIGGTVIGINTAIDQQGQLVGFAIPVNDAQKDIESFKKFGKIIKPFLGVRYVLINDTVKEENKLSVNYGALIVSGGKTNPAVVAGSAADKAGLTEGDIILEVNGKRIDQDHSLAGLLKNYDPGDVIKMKVLSKGKEKEITVTLGESK